MPNRIKAILGFLVGAALFCFAVVYAKAQEVEQGTGLVCDTAELVEQFVTLHNEGKKNADVLAEINKDKSVCAVLTAAFYVGKTVKRVVADGVVYEIASILLVGIFTGQQWMRVPPDEVFSIFPSKERGA